MRDGSVLRATVYRPDAEGAFPVLLLRTPYGKDISATTHLAIDPERAAASGYIVVIQDVRGRFASDGYGFDPYIHEFDDGFDTVQWAASLPGANGAVGAYGVSYMGTTAWQAAAMAPPALRAIAAAQSTNDIYRDLSWRGGAFNWGMFLFWVLGALGLPQLMRDWQAQPDFEKRLHRLLSAIDGYAATANCVPPSALPAADPATLVAPFFQQAMAHDVPGLYHRERSMRDRYADVGVPALVVAGWYDVMLSNDLRHFTEMRASAGSSCARERSRLIVGPWSHGPGLAGSVVGELDFGIRASGSSLDLRGDLTALMLDWFQHTLRDGAAEESSPVKLFVMGTNRWRDEDEWPPKNVQVERWFLRDQDRLSREPGPSDTSPASYVYDPVDPCPTTGGALLMPDVYRRGPVDQRPVRSRSDVLSFTSERLESDLEILGPVSAVLFASTTGCDTDWVVKLCDEYPDGRTLNLCDGILRARFRDGESSAPQLVQPGAIVRYDVDLWATAAVVSAGHRLCVMVTSSDFPRYDRNPNTGTPGIHATSFASAEQRIFLDAARPSHVALPVANPRTT